MEFADKCNSGTEENTLISRTALNERVREWGLREDVVEKDYVIGWVLWGIGSDARLAISWAFKGGTCLKKCYIETYRFSEDLDFTVLPSGPIEPTEVIPILQRILSQVYDEAGIDFSVREPVVQIRPDGNSAEARIYYRGPRGAPQAASIKLDLTINETVVRPTVLRPISHPYPDQLPSSNVVRCYGFEELFAEKLRAMGERCRPRDLYDIVFLFRQRDLLPHAELIRSVHIEKCRNKGVPVTTLASLEASPYHAEIEAEWANMLEHQLYVLPPFEHFWQELPNLFAWLEGSMSPDELPSLPLVDADLIEWSPPPTAWVWGEGIPLEAVRFAATNHLCIELGYKESSRLIEPYSLRKTRDGNLLLYAIKASSGELHAYRVDRIQSVTASNVPFKPRYAIEFAQSGPLSAPHTRRDSIFKPRRGMRQGVTIYIIECSYCGKQFRRSKLDTRLRTHKTKGGEWECPGRIGYLVDQHYA